MRNNNGVQQYINNAMHQQQMSGNITQNTSNTHKNIKPNAQATLQQKKVIDYQQQIHNQQQSNMQQSHHQHRQSINFYPSQQQQQLSHDQNAIQKMSSQNKQNLHKLKENQEDVIDQLNQFMHQYSTAQPQQQALTKNKQVNTNALRDSTNYVESQYVKKDTTSRIGNQDIQKSDVQQLRMSTVGFINDTEQEDYEKYKHYTNDYINENNNDLLSQQLHKKTHAIQNSNNNRVNQVNNNNIKGIQIQTQQSKSPTPMVYNGQIISTPTSLQEVKTSQQNPMMILNQFNMQQHHRNPSLHLNQGFKSHQLPNQDATSNLIKGKKKSISITNSYTSNNGTFSNTNISNNTKRQSMHHDNQKINTNVIGSGGSSTNTTTMQAKAFTQAHTANTSKEPHKKSQSLYNKKIVDIITGLQQSLGVIASNVQNSFNNNQIDGSSGSSGPILKGDQQKALLESALLAQKIAQMTTGIRKDSIVMNSNNIKKNSDIDKMVQQVGKDQSNKRKSMKICSNLSGRGSLIIAQKHKQGFKTLEDTQNEKLKKTHNSNRMSLDFQQPKKSVQHYRKGESSHTIDNTIMSDTLAAKYRSAMTNPQSSGQSSNITNTIDNPRQSIGNSLQRKHTATMSSGERLSEAAYLNKKFKKPDSLLIQPNDPHYEQRLKSTASSPSLHQMNQNKQQQQQQFHQNTVNAQTSSGQLLQRKVHLSTQSNTVFDFGTQKPTALTTATASNYKMNDKQKSINQKKKSLNIAQQKPKDSQTTKSEQTIKSINNNHKRSTSDGSSLTKMFHFKQQMLINKIFQQQQNQQPTQVSYQTANPQNIQTQQQQQQNKKQRTSLSKNYNQQQIQNQYENNQKASKKAINNKVQVISSLSSKRLSYEENQENMMFNNHLNNNNIYQSPRAQTATLSQKQNFKLQQQQTVLQSQVSNSNNQSNHQVNSQLDVKLSQDMKSFLQKFKNKQDQQVVSVNNDTQQQKQLLIQAITHQQAINNQGVIQKHYVDDNSYMTQKQQKQPISQKQYSSNLPSDKKSLENPITSSYNFDPNSKRQSQQIQRAHQVIQSHKRAKSDANKQTINTNQQQNYNQNYLNSKAQQILNQANSHANTAKQQKMFFLNLNQQQQPASTNNSTGLTSSMLVGKNNKDYGMKQQQHIQNNNQNSMLQYNENYQLIPYAQQQNNFVYSARASPSKQNNIYYNFDESQKQYQLQGSTITKPYLPTARSDTSAKIIKNGMSNQTTQKKICYSTNINNNRLIESVNTRLIYPEQNYDQLMKNQGKSGQNILQSQQFTKLSSILYGDTSSQNATNLNSNNIHILGSHNNPHAINKQIGGATIYSTQENIMNNNNSDSIVYQAIKDEHMNIMSDKYGAKQHKHFFGSENSFKQNDVKSVNQSPKLKVMPTPKLNQPGGANQISNFYENIITQQSSQQQHPVFKPQQQNEYVGQHQQINANFMINPLLQQQQQKLMSKPKVQEYQVLHTEQDLDEIDLIEKQRHNHMQITENNEEDDGQQPIIQFNNNLINYNKEFEGNQFQTFESNLTTHTMNNMTPRARDRHRLVKQIKLSFNKLKEPIKTTSEFYRIGKMLGKGAFGRVNLAIHKLCNQLVAVKSINKQFLSEDESSKKKMMQEMLILQKTRHDNLVRLYDSFETNKHVVFVMELCAGGDLLNYVRKRRKLKEPVAKYVFRQVVAGLHYCHQKGIIHRDMKLDNLLFDEQGIVKICDFGVSKLLSSPNEIMTEQCGTPAYIAPEILKDKGYKGFGVDIWSLGVCLYAMLFGTVPFKANNMGELHQLIMKAKYTFKEDPTKNGEQPLSDDVKNLIKHLLEPNPDKRITMQGILNHRWMKDDPSEEQEKIEIFTEQELETIRKDFTYQDMARYKRNQALKKKIDQQNNQQMQQHNPQLGVGGVVTTEENLFTEHALDSTQNVLMKNCSTKSVVLAPFNSTRTHIAKEDLILSRDNTNEDQDLKPIGSQDCDESGTYIPPLPIDPAMIVDKRIIKYAPRVKDINRQYEMNNNCDVDNGVYNKFVKQSTDNAGGDDDADRSKSENSLVTSMNGDCQENLLEQQNNQQYAAPLVSQNSDQEAEAELIKKQQNYQDQYKQSELHQLQTFLQQQHNQHGKSEFTQCKDEPVLIDYEVVERVETYGYPRAFIISSIENFDMNDAATNYYLLDKEKQQIDDYNYANQFH